MKPRHCPIVLAAVIGSVIGFCGPVQAQGRDRHAVATSVKPVAANAAAMSEGEVRKVDAARREITLKHGPLKNLDMPGMTMAFQLADPAMLGKVKAGDKVRFVAANPGGRLTITEIEVVR